MILDVVFNHTAEGNEDGSPMNDPPLLKNLAFDPILGNVKLIAEAWDAGGLYQVGQFPAWHRWAE